MTRREQLREKRQAYCKAANYREETEEILKFFKNKPIVMTCVLCIGEQASDRPRTEHSLQKKQQEAVTLEAAERDAYPNLRSMLLGGLITLVVTGLTILIMGQLG